MTVLAKVVLVHADQCRVELYPGCQVDIAPEDAGTSGDLRWDLTVDEVLPVLIVHRDIEQDQWLLSAVDAGENIEEAPSILEGGPPWLVMAPRDTQTLAFLDNPAWDVEDVRTLIPDNHEHGIEIIRGLREELLQTQKELRKAQGERDLAQTQLAESKARRRDLARDIAKERKKEPGTDFEGLFEDEVEQFTFEIHVAWAKRIPAPDKGNRPLCRWDYGPDFFDTLHQTQGISRAKILDVVVEVLTGLVETIPARELHMLRTGFGGDDPVRKSEDGVYWRVSMQVKTASARRLHYLKRTDGSIQLCSIRLHDDMRT